MVGSPSLTPEEKILIKSIAADFKGSKAGEAVRKEVTEILLNPNNPNRNNPEYLRTHLLEPTVGWVQDNFMQIVLKGGKTFKSLSESLSPDKNKPNEITAKQKEALEIIETELNLPHQSLVQLALQSLSRPAQPTLQPQPAIPQSSIIPTARTIQTQIMPMAPGDGNNPNVAQMYSLAYGAANRLAAKNPNAVHDLTPINQFLAQYAEAAKQDSLRIQTDINTIRRNAANQGIAVAQARNFGVGAWQGAVAAPRLQRRAAMLSAYYQQADRVIADGRAIAAAEQRALAAAMPQIDARSAQKRHLLIQQFDAQYRGNAAWEEFKGAMMEHEGAQIAERKKQQGVIGGLGWSNLLGGGGAALLAFFATGGGLTGIIAAVIAFFAGSWAGGKISDMMKPSAPISPPGAITMVPPGQQPNISMGRSQTVQNGAVNVPTGQTVTPTRLPAGAQVFNPPAAPGVPGH